MDGLNEKDKKPAKKGFFAHLGGVTLPKTKAQTAMDISVFAIALLFARCHVIFGAHPLGIALLAVLPFRIWYALAGAVIGSLTLGKAGIIYSMISVIVVFLRVIVYGGDRPKGEDRSAAPLFSEKLALRLCSAVIGGFIISVYEILLSGFNITGALFGLSMILITPSVAFLLSGLFDSGINLSAFIRDGSEIFRTPKASENERLNMIFFRISSGTLIFLLSLSLKGFEIFGINAAYIFASFLTLLLSKRMGSLYGAIVGFVASFGLSPLYSVAFALAGIASGFLFKLGTPYALIGSLAAMSLWSAYSSGLVGFLATFPEYIIGASLAFPLLKGLPTERTPDKRETTEVSARDMVGTMALAYQNKYTGSLDALELALSELSSVISDFAKSGGKTEHIKYKDLIAEEADRLGASPSKSADIPIAQIADNAAKKLSNGERLSASDLSGIFATQIECEMVADAVNRRICTIEGERFRRNEMLCSAEDLSVISKMINEARLRDEAEKNMDTALTEKLSEIFTSAGFDNGTIRAFGERQKHIICAGDDPDGSKITAPELKAEIEAAANVKLGTPEYFRRGDTVLMECTATERVECEFATASVAGSEREISGDTAKMFKSKDSRFFALISDGMGSGEVAMETSSFAADFLSGMLTHGYSKDTVLHILNGIIKSRGDECSATVDLFELDLITCEGQFIKSGAAASYVKRDSSLFRIRSRTAPIGLMKQIDAERIRVEVQSGDYIIMLSDGINQSPEEAPWLIELLAKPARRNLQEYADLILRTAIGNNPPRDDMTVAVVKINPIS